MGIRVKKERTFGIQKQKTKPRLYDPETGEYLNDKTMKVIEDAHKGTGVIHYDSLQDFYKEVRPETLRI